MVNKLTGEVMELPVNSPVDIKDSWLLVSESIKALERAKDKLKPFVAGMLDENGQYDYGDYIFKHTTVQRQTYAKGVMREVLDADMFDLFLSPDKTKIDAWLKENVATSGGIGTALRNSMIPMGNPYSVLRLEKVKRDEPRI